MLKVFNEDIQLHTPSALTIDVYKKNPHDIYFHDNISGYFHFIKNEVILASANSIHKLTNDFFSLPHILHPTYDKKEFRIRQGHELFVFGREKVKVQQNATPTPPDMPKELCCLEF